MGVFFSMPRDRDSGYIYPDAKSGQPRVAYTPSNYDRAHALEGIITLAKICYVTGAEEIRPFNTARPFLREESKVGTDEEKAEFDAWLEEVRAAGNPVSGAWGGAHQMGSCRMSASAEDGVVDPTGKVWGVEGLYVSDASVFPGASGVNPMITTMAISDRISHGIAAELSNTAKAVTS
jgi:choline dehydrogenase-like flavoprotein